MSEIIQKISSYNLFNNLFPGIVFSVLLEQVTSYSIVQKDIFVNAFLFYFIGMVISRVGSILLEEVLKWTKFVKFSDYSDYLKAQKNYPKIEIHSETNNTYRTLLATFVVLGLAKLYEIIAHHCQLAHETNMTLLIIGLFFLFLFSYRKQTGYITKQVEAYREVE